MLQDRPLSLECMLEKFATVNERDIEVTREQLDEAAQWFVDILGEYAWFATVLLERVETRTGNPGGAAKWILLGKRILEGDLVPPPPLRTN